MMYTCYAHTLHTHHANKLASDPQGVCVTCMHAVVGYHELFCIFPV
jgi:hypothetical protein